MIYLISPERGFSLKSNSQNEKNGSETTNAVGNRKSVTVIGLGPMGQAMADVFWNTGTR